LLAVGFGAWRQILSPWVLVADGADHGWPRTPELHRLADSCAALLFIAIAAGLVVLAFRPRERSGLAAWTGGMLAVTGAFAWLSAAMQHQDVQPALVTSLVWLAVVSLLLLALHPEGRHIVRGGVPERTAAPRGAVRVALLLLGAAGVSLALGALIWRLSGGLFESPLEDDVFSLVYLGLAWALGATLAAAGRAGWRPLTAILLMSGAYAVVAGISLALA
jgi:hypothetical protein